MTTHIAYVIRSIILKKNSNLCNSVHKVLHVLLHPHKSHKKTYTVNWTSKCSLACESFTDNKFEEQQNFLYYVNGVSGFLYSVSIIYVAHRHFFDICIGMSAHCNDVSNTANVNQKYVKRLFTSAKVWIDPHLWRILMEEGYLFSLKIWEVSSLDTHFRQPRRR